MDSIDYIRKSENYLPAELADFHDQKSLFKALQELYGQHEAFKGLPNSWADNHVFTIDFLLYFFALHGYKLQKIRRADVEFYKLGDTVRHYEKLRNDRDTAMLASALSRRSDE